MASTSSVLDNDLRSSIASALVNNREGNACPIIVRLAWHASGTFDKDDKTEKHGGSDGATMRFSSELRDPANAGLIFAQKILEPVKEQHPDVSYADLWTLAGVHAIKLSGGPEIPYKYGRTDVDSSAACPANGRLPDASFGAEHLRQVFHRMGFDDRDIVALSGAHTLGSCQQIRSGYSGPWTTDPYKWDNEYYKNLLTMEWKLKIWDGPRQYEDPSGKLTMLPTDMALVEDEKFLPIVQEYAADEGKFNEDFTSAFSRLLALGCPTHVQPDSVGG